MTFIILYS